MLHQSQIKSGNSLIESPERNDFYICSIWLFRFSQFSIEPHYSPEFDYEDMRQKSLPGRIDLETSLRYGVVC